MVFPLKIVKKNVLLHNIPVMKQHINVFKAEMVFPLKIVMKNVRNLFLLGDVIRKHRNVLEMMNMVLILLIKAVTIYVNQDILKHH